jgi:acetylornithine deacetylase/succinyl-diaminopimelate desuccinylase-like protein
MIHGDNAVTALAEAVARVGRHQWPVQLPDATKTFLESASRALGVEFDPADPGSVIGKLGGMGKMIGATVQHTANPTGLKAGYKVNVIPQTATADVDGRFLPGREDEFFTELDRLLGSAVTREFIHHDMALETTPDGDLWEAMAASLHAEDPEATVVPYCLSAGTDAKWFSRLGVRCFGFSPLQMPSELDFFGMFHGIDERVPVDGLKFGVRVLDRLLDRC